MDTFAKRLLALIGSLLLIVYVGYQAFLSVYSPFKTETAISYSEYETIDTEGLVLRNESTIPLTQSGYVYYVAENGSRVAKGGSIADIYADEQSASAQQTLTRIENEITQLQSIQEQGENSRTDLNIINTQLQKVQREILSAATSPCFSGMEDMASDLLTLMNKQQIIIGRASDFSDRITQLQAQRDQLQASATGKTGSITSPIAGYFVNTVDGYETTLDFSAAESLTTAQIRAAVEEPPTVTGSYAGKVVSSYEWYLACIVSTESLSRLSVDSTMKVRLPFVSNETIPVTLIAENRDRDGNVALIFRCDYMSAELSNIRYEQVQILVEEYTGLRVPDEAVHFNDNNEAGVYVQEGTMILFRRIRVLYHSETDSYSICAVEDDDDYLQLYDDIVLEGKNLYDGKIVRG